MVPVAAILAMYAADLADTSHLLRVPGGPRDALRRPGLH